ncbi:helix-turn-helix domain-containing protein [Neolewinella agarilytica]|uniref:AraC-type DNA-binding protein n=1 Tax=Neolewinella agarilytica TaxID=478744 RepID=A0A1H9I9L7_9BACT|nr:AraC family transcriptional regulator [Neolewinella agarilytica]SEQ71254.1 AraC-type DNA-binding protein [Neolewinella agarilytica]
MPTSNYLKISTLRELAEIAAGQGVVQPRDEYQLIFLHSGKVSLTLSEKKYLLKGRTLSFLAPGQHFAINDYSDGTNGIVLTFDTDYFLLCLKNQIKLCFYPFFQFSSYPVLKLTTVEWKSLSAIREKIAFEYRNRKSLNDDLLCRLQLNILLIEIERIYTANKLTDEAPISRRHAITAKFKQLVDDNFLTLRGVSDYADKLYLSTTYLSDTVKRVTGRPASALIYDRLIEEIKGELVQTEDTINQIASRLAFNDVSYLCRFFKKHTGMSPQQFRQTNHF